MTRKDELPQLKAAGLYAANTAGDGNCLFNALSDQLYGNQSQHAKLRSATINYMRANVNHFKSFIVTNPGGGHRRNPKRKNAGTSATSRNMTTPSAEEIEATFQRYLKIMAQGGAYGDNMEIVAFSNAFKANVRILSEAFGGWYSVDYKGEDAGDSIRTLFIVHHSWEHYSSIRNITGPHSGLPQIEASKVFAGAQGQTNAELAEVSHVQDWMVDETLRSLPFLADRNAIKKALQLYKGNVNDAVSSLLPGSSQGSGGSSSIERDPESDEEIEQKPKKKQNCHSKRPCPLKLNNNLPVRTKGTHPLSPNPNQLSAALSKIKDEYDPDETEEEDWQHESSCKDSESTSVSTSASDYSASSRTKSGPIRLKLSQPKKQADKARPISHVSLGEYDADAEQAKHSLTPVKPRRRLITSYERDRLEAQKAARLASVNSSNVLHSATKKQNQSAPVLSMGIKVLSI